MNFIRRAKKARKVLTEFRLKDGRKLRIDLVIWGNREYARKLGYYGNAIYKPLIVNEDGETENIYSGKDGLPKLEELSDFYHQWKALLANESERTRLKEVANTIRELAEESTYFDGRQAHVVYKLLQIARKELVFGIDNLEDVERLSAEICPAIVVSFKGYNFIKSVHGFMYGTKMFEVFKMMKSIDHHIEQEISNIKHDLSMFVKSREKRFSEEGPKIRLEDIADEILKSISHLH